MSAGTALALVLITMGAVFVGCSVGIAAGLLVVRPLRRGPLLRRRVLLQLVNHDVFDAVLWQERGDLVVLRDVRYRPARGNQEPIALDGEVVVERDRIEWAQVPPARAG